MVNLNGYLSNDFILFSFSIYFIIHLFVCFGRLTFPPTAAGQSKKHAMHKTTTTHTHTPCRQQTHRLHLLLLLLAAPPVLVFAFVVFVPASPASGPMRSLR